MTDIEIDKALALAIGWKERDIVTSQLYGRVLVWVGLTEEFPNGWRQLSYKDWNVIGPIAARYNAFPIQSAKGTWSACVGDGSNMWVDHIDTPQKAIALAVIGAKHGTKT